MSLSWYNKSVIKNKYSFFTFYSIFVIMTLVFVLGIDKILTMIITGYGAIL